MTLNATMKKKIYRHQKQLKQSTKQRNEAIIERTNKHTQKTACKQRTKNDTLDSNHNIN